MSSQTIMVVLAKTKLEIIDYEQLLDQFWSDGTADRGSWIPMRLEKYASKNREARGTSPGWHRDGRRYMIFCRVLVHYVLFPQS